MMFSKRLYALPGLLPILANKHCTGGVVRLHKHDVIDQDHIHGPRPKLPAV